MTRDESGFTLLEFIIVLFLLGGLLSLVVPRMSFGDSVTSVGRRWVGSLRSLQDMATSTQKTVRLYIDLDRGSYWPVVLEGGQEKPPTDANWAAPLALPDMVRFADVSVGGTRKESGKADVFFYPNGRIDPATVHLIDAGNTVVGIMIEPVTSAIRLTDERIEAQKPMTIPDRTKALLQPVQAGVPAAVPAGVKK